MTINANEVLDMLNNGVLVHRGMVVEMAQELQRITHERDMLGQAIADAALKAGIYNGEVDLTGPHLIMFAQHLGEAAEALAGKEFDASVDVVERAR